MISRRRLTILACICAVLAATAIAMRSLNQPTSEETQAVAIGLKHLREAEGLTRMSEIAESLDVPATSLQKMAEKEMQQSRIYLQTATDKQELRHSQNLVLTLTASALAILAILATTYLWLTSPSSK